METHPTTNTNDSILDLPNPVLLQSRLDPVSVFRSNENPELIDLSDESVIVAQKEVMSSTFSGPENSRIHREEPRRFDPSSSDVISKNIESRSILADIRVNHQLGTQRHEPIEQLQRFEPSSSDILRNLLIDPTLESSSNEQVFSQAQTVNSQRFEPPPSRIYNKPSSLRNVPNTDYFPNDNRNPVQSVGQFSRRSYDIGRPSDRQSRDLGGSSWAMTSNPYHARDRTYQVPNTYNQFVEEQPNSRVYGSSAVDHLTFRSTHRTVNNREDRQASAYGEAPTGSRLSQVRFEDDVVNASIQAQANQSQKADVINYSNPYVDFADRLDNFRFSPLHNHSHTGSTPFRPNKFQDVSTWNLKYNGQTSVTDFLERVEELRLSRAVPKEYLLRAAPEMFTRDALLWFRTKDFSSWDDLVTQLRDTFQPFDYEYSLWEEIHHRTQGSQERVVSFVVAMEALFRKLPVPPSEIKRLQIIRRNLLPHIQRRLAVEKIEKLNDLLRLSRAIEETEARIQRFVPPPTNYRNLVEPSLAYNKPSSHIAMVDRLVPEDDASVPSVLEPNPVVAAVASPPNCWNCLEAGHRFRQCSKPRRKFCFKCGKENVISRDCPNCSKNEIARRLL